MIHKDKITLTLGLIVVNACVWVSSILLNWYTGYDVILMWGAKYTPLIIEGEYWRIVTPMFLHIGITHLFMNEYSLYLLGPLVENSFGKVRFLLIYLFAGIAGNLASAWFLPKTISAGASGAIFGLLGAWFYLGLKYRSRLPKAFLSNVIFMIVINIAYGLMVSNIDNYAHIGGLVGGFLITTIVAGIHK